MSASRRATDWRLVPAGPVWRLYAVLVVLLVGYLGLLVGRVSAVDSTWCGWLVDGFEIAVAGLCIVRGVTRRTGRAVAIVLGLGAMTWALGDLVLTVESLGGAEPSVPSFADGAYVLFYPLTYAAVVIAMRGEIRRLSSTAWLDGGVAGLGAAAVCAGFAFHTVLAHTGGGAWTVATNLVYPIGDLLLLLLIVGGSAVIFGYRRASWLLLATGLAINVVGDTFNLLGATDPSNLLGHTSDAMAWPTSLLLISMSVWVRPRQANPLVVEKQPGFMLPGIAAASALVILIVGTVEHPNRIAEGLAVATLLLAGLRLARSVGSLHALTEERLHQAITDELTGLGNRRYLFQILDTYFSQPADQWQRQLAFLFLDLDHFKEINDTFGHAAGDELLRQIGPRLTAALRTGDALVRLGGDEFAVVLVDTDRETATTIAERIAASLSEPFDLDVVRPLIGASIGIAVAPDDANDGAGLVWCADVAMYRAKAAGRSHAVYDPQVDDAGHQWRLTDELRDAIDHGQLVLHYQPQLDLRTGKVVAVEALVRWQHPRLGIIPPQQFLGIAEDAGLMRSLTEHVLDQALAQCVAWRAGGHGHVVAVNVSPATLLEPGFADFVVASLAAHKLPAASLIIEITEHGVITDFEAARRVIESLRGLGVVVSIDDFGAGFTSLAHLGSLGVGELKLDRAFIARLGRGGDRERDLQLVQATIELGHAMGLRVVAEGIEDAETLNLIAGFGCDVAQGYYICAPQPADQLVVGDIASQRITPSTGAELGVRRAAH